MAENELLRVSQDLSNRLFWNEFWLRSIARHRTYRGQQVRADVQGNSKIVLVAGLIELMFWVVVSIILGGTMLLALAGLFMIVFNIG